MPAYIRTLGPDVTVQIQHYYPDAITIEIYITRDAVEQNRKLLEALIAWAKEGS
jgi:hypothetical protein